LLLLVAGCGGINASKSVSPLDFLMPGIGSFLKADPSPSHPDSNHPDNNQPKPAEEPVIVVAQN